jgi:hypothetical protein
MALKAGDELKTGVASQVFVEFAGGGEGVVDSGSHFRVKGDRTLLGVIGEVWLKVRGRFRVETERVAAAIIGTEFGIELKGDGRMVLVVLEGTVIVEGISGPVEVKRSEVVETDPRGVVGRPQMASSGVLNRTWDLAWDVRRAVSGMIAEVAFVYGNASVKRGYEAIPVEIGMAILKGDRLSTGENTRVEVRSKERTALDIKGGVEGLDVGAIVLSKEPLRRLWAETVWGMVQKLASGGKPSTITQTAGVRAEEEGKEEQEFEFETEEDVAPPEEEKVIPPSEVEKAIAGLEEVAKGEGPQAEEATYLIAESYRYLANEYLAEVYYKRVIERFPNGKYASLAREQMGGP